MLNLIEIKMQVVKTLVDKNKLHLYYRNLTFDIRYLINTCKWIWICYDLYKWNEHKIATNNWHSSLIKKKLGSPK